MSVERIFERVFSDARVLRDKWQEALTFYPVCSTAFWHCMRIYKQQFGYDQLESFKVQMRRETSSCTAALMTSVFAV